MALSKSEVSDLFMLIVLPVLPVSAIFAAFALVVLSDGPIKNKTGGGSGEAAVSDTGDMLIRGSINIDKESAAYWAVDRIEDASGGDGIAVLENIETLRTEERSVKELPAGVEEGQLLLGGGAAGGFTQADIDETAKRTAKISERFERLKIGQ